MARARSGKWTIAIAAIVALSATAVVFVSMLIVSFGECLNENGDHPLSFPWSPRREYCRGGSEEYTALMLLLPSLIVAVAAVLWWVGRRRLAAVALVLLVPLPFLPPLYLRSLDYYLIYEYPILHAPLLRVATDGAPPRVCYAYGIIAGPKETPIDDSTTRTCLDLVPNEEALALTGEYDEGHTPYTLEWVGKKLTERGLPPKTGVEIYRGIVASRWYRLSESAAELNSVDVGAS